MAHPRDPDPPAVRPLEPDGASPPPRSPRFTPALIAGVVGLVIGFVAGVVVAESPEPTAAGSTTTSRPAPRDLVTAPPPTRSTVPAATTTTRGAIAPDLTLGEMVPGFEGTLLYSAGDPDRRLGRWSHLATAPTEVDLPPGAAGGEFDASGRWAAVIAFAAQGNALYVGPAADLRPAFIGADSFAWHDEAPGAIAFVSGPPGDGDPVELYAGTVSSLGFDVERVATLDAGFITTPFVSWGDWGFALQGRGPNGVLRLTTVAPDGEMLTTRNDLYLSDTRPDGTLLVARLFDEPSPATGRDYEFVYTDVTLTSDRPGPPDMNGLPQWSPSGEFVAHSTDSLFVPAVTVHGDADSFSIVLDADDAFVLGWTPDDRFIVAWTPRTLTRDGFGPALLFVDLTDRSVNAVPVAGVVTEIGFER